MSLFEKLKNKRSSLQEKKDDGIKKPTKKANKEVFDVTGKSAARDAKKYSSGEYPKIGGGQRIGSKSKGPGAETGAKVNLNPTSGSKSKGTTPVKVNITKPVKQSEISKQAKKFTKKINKKNINRPEGVIGDTYVSTTKKGKIRSAKKVNPTLKKSISQVKSDIEFKQSLKKAGASGDVSDTAPKKIRDYVTKKREARATKLGTPDPFTVDTSKAAKQTAKDFGTPTKSQIKKLDKKLGGYRAPKGIFGKGLTQGQANVLRMDKSSFPITPYKEYDPIKQPRGVKIPGKTYKDFSKKLKKDVAKTSSSTPRTVTKKYKPTTTVKQSEVSKQAKDFTTKVNQARTKKVTPTTTASKPKTTNVFKRVTAATSGKKVTNSKGIGNQFRGAENKAARNAEIIKRGGSVTGGGGKPPKPPRNVTFSAADFPDDKSRKIVKKVTGSGKVNTGGGTRTPRTVTKQTKALMSGQQKFAKSVVGKGLKKNLPTVYKGLKALKPAGRAFAKTGVVGGLATIGLAASPAVRGFLKKAAAGGVAGGIIGGAAAAQRDSDKERIKQMKKPVFKDEILDKKGKQKFPDSKKVATMGLNLSDISKPKKKDKGRTPQSIATEVDYLKKRQKVAPYGAKYTG